MELNDQPHTEFTLLTTPRSVNELAEDKAANEKQRIDADALKYCSRWLKRVNDTSARELDVSLPAGLSSPGASFTLSIAYTFPSELLNYGAISVYQSRPQAKNRYIQMIGSSVANLGRFLIPGLDGPGERISNWDLEYSVFAGKWQDSFDRIHVVSAGVLCRQFVNDERTVKVFHYKIQDLPTCTAQISFVVGVFDAVRIPGVPFAYAFGPVGKASQLTLISDFLSKAFNFYNWYLNSASGGALKALNSLSSEVFPFPSFYLVFAKDLAEPLCRANTAILPAELLHDGTQIEQTIETRRALCLAIAQQYFSLRIDLKYTQDAWLLEGITRYLSELQLKTFHGNNDYRFGVRRDILRLVQLEASSENLYVPPLAALAAYLEEQGPKLNPLDRARLSQILHLKSRLVFVLLERKIEWTFLQKLLGHLYTESLINRQQHREGFSFGLFLKLIKRLTGKDLKSFTDMWISNSGCPQVTLSFLHNRKRSVIEFEVQQVAGRRLGSSKFSGNLTVRIQESEIVHEHVVHLDESTLKFEVPFHSKAKKARKKRPANADEAPEDESNSANKEDEALLSETLVSPISWIRLDPEMEWLAEFSLNQPDIMWIEALENDRDVVSQFEAVRALPAISSASESVCFALERFINDWKAFYGVRVEAIMAMSTIGATLPRDNPLRLLGARRLVEMFNKKFGHSNSSLVALPKANNFEIISNVFVQQAIAEGVSRAICLCFSQGHESGELTLVSQPSSNQQLEAFVGFFSSLLRFNDNSTNAYSDSEYLATIIRAGTAVFARLQDSPRFANQFATFVAQLHRYARLEFILPSFKNVVMCAVLEACAVLRFPPEFAQDTILSLQGDLQNLVLPTNSLSVRLEAVRLYAQFFREHGFTSDLFTLLQMMCADGSPAFRQLIAQDASFYESLQFLLRSMDDSSLDETLHAWLLGPDCARDRRTWTQIMASLVSLLGSASDDESASASNQPAAGKLKITLNLASLSQQQQQQQSQQQAQQQQASPSLTTSGSFDDDDDIWLRELTSDQKHKQPTASNPEGSIDEKAKLLRVWNALWANYDSIPFRYAVDPSVPNYYAVIKEPMDLSRIRERLSTLQVFLTDLRLMLRNCYIFNQPESLICEQAKRLGELAMNELKEAFPKEKKMIKRVLRGATGESPLNEDLADDVFATPQKSAKTSTMATPVGPSRLESQMRNILNRLCRHKHAYFFLEPVDPVALNIPNYPLIIKNPMDFGTIRSRLSSYESVEEFRRDCQLVFDNCKTFNAPGTLVYQVALELEATFQAEMQKHFGHLLEPLQVGETAEPATPVAPKIKISLNFKK